MFLPYFCTPKNKHTVSKAGGNEEDLVAQLVEHNTFNVGVLGSSPSRITKASHKMRGFFMPLHLIFY